MKRILPLFLLLCITISGFAQTTVQGHPRPDIRTTKAAKATKSDTSFTFDNIQYWVGEGSNKAALVVQWNDGKNPDAIVWGYKWDGQATGEQMVQAIAKADKRFYTLFYSGTQYGTAIGGIGFDIDGEGAIALALSGNTTYPKYPTDGIVNTSNYDFDDWAAMDNNDHWQSGWMSKGYWSYYVKDSQTDDFGYSGLGASSRILQNGSWDAWSFMPEFSGGELSDNFVAVAPYIEPVVDFTKGIFFVNEDWFGWSNGSVNFMTENYKMVYRPYSEINNNEGFGATTQYGSIYGDKFYFISKQAKDGGDTQRTPGGRLVITEAGTLKKIKGFDNIGGGDGRSFIGVNDSTGYIGTSGGIFLFDIKKMEVGTIIDGTGGGSLYNGQIGNMAYTGKYVFAIRQSLGVFVIDPQTNTIVHTITGSFNTLTQSKDGNVWLAQSSKLIKVNPFTLETMEVTIPTGMSVGNSWGAWNAGSFCASIKQNVLYWSAGGGFTGGGAKVIKYDIDNNEFNGAFFTLPDQDKTYKQMFYGAGLRVDPVTDNLVMTASESGFGAHYQNNWIHIVSNQGSLLKTVKLNNYYWFPAMPVFPDNYAPTIDNSLVHLMMKGNTPLDVYLGDKISDFDNLSAAIGKSITIEDNTLIDASIENDHLIIIPKVKSGKAYLNLSVNSNGKITSLRILADIVSAPEITEEPIPVIEYLGNKLALTLGATGGNLVYQWYKNDKIIEGATEATYTIEKSTLEDNGEYYCIVSNSEGTITSNKAKLTVKLREVKITTQPLPISAGLNDNILFSVVATGDNLEYQWYKNSTIVQGANSSTYSIKKGNLEDNGEYYCVVSNAVGSITSDKVRLTIKVKEVQIVTHPISLEAGPNETVLFTIVAIGDNLEYQWYKDNVVIADAISNKLELASINASNDGEYYCVVSNIVSTKTSDKAILKIGRWRQTISFGTIPVISLDKKTYQLNATSSSGLKVSFTSSNTGIATVNDKGLVTLKTSGKAVITARQEGDTYYQPAVSIDQNLEIESNDASLKALTINGEEWNIADRYIIDCSETSNNLLINIEGQADANISVAGKTIANNQLTIDVNKPSVQDVTFTIRSQDGSVNQSYTLTVEKYFAFDDIVVQRWNNTLLVNNSSATNGNYNFIGYRWFKDGSEISTRQYYSAGSKKTDILDASANYYVQVTTDKGEVLRTCSSALSLRSLSVKAYPNPANPGEAIYIESDIDQEMFDNAKLEIYNINGFAVSTHKITNRITTINAPVSSGTYLIKFRSGGFERDMKIIVK